MAIGFRNPLYRKSPQINKAAAFGTTLLWHSAQWREIERALQTTTGTIPTRLDLTTVEGQTMAYGRCAPVAAIVSKIAEYAQNGRYCFTDSKGQETTTKNPLTPILQRPNPMQTWSEFVASAVAFIKLNGQCYILPVTPVGMSKANAQALYVIPNWMVTPTYTGNRFFQTELKGIVRSYRVSGMARELLPQELIIVRDTMPSIINQEPEKAFEGMSRLYSLGDQVNNLIAIQDALYMLTVRRGAMGAWVPENRQDGTGVLMPLEPKERDAVIAQFQEYGINSGHKSPFMVLERTMKWVQAAMNAGDLRLFEGNEAAIGQVAMNFNVPVYLLGLKDSTFTNLETAGKHCYQSAVIPCVENLVTNINDWFGMETVTLTVYFDHLEVFQKAKKDEADALASLTSALDRPFKARVIGVSEYRNMMANFMPSGTPFDPEAMPEDLYEGQPTQTIVTQ